MNTFILNVVCKNLSSYPILRSCKNGNHNKVNPEGVKDRSLIFSLILHLILIPTSYRAFNYLIRWYSMVCIYSISLFVMLRKATGKKPVSSHEDAMSL